MKWLPVFSVLLLLAFAGCAASPPLPPQQNTTQEMSQQLCESSGGRWNDCGPPGACRDPRSMRVCPAVCVQYCECGVGIGVCPAGYSCGAYVPDASGTGEVGICSRA